RGPKVIASASGFVRCPTRSAPGIRLAQSADVNLPAAASLTIDTSSGPLESTGSVSGILVIDTSPQLRACLLHIIERRVRPVIVIDLSGISYLATSAVATLIEAARV